MKLMKTAILQCIEKGRKRSLGLLLVSNQAFNSCKTSLFPLLVKFHSTSLSFLYHHFVLRISTNILQLFEMGFYTKTISMNIYFKWFDVPKYLIICKLYLFIYIYLMPFLIYLAAWEGSGR